MVQGAAVAIAVACVAGLLYVFFGSHFSLTAAKERPPYRMHGGDEVLVIDDFLTASECDEVIRIGTPNLKKSVQANEAGAAVEDDYRSSSSTRLPYRDTIFHRSLNKRIAEVSGLPPSHFQELQLARYEQGQAYGLHRDEHEEGNRAGGRVATMLVYLADVDSGGETLFTREPLERLDNLTRLSQKMVHFRKYCQQHREEQLLVSPRKGRAVFWWTFSPEGNDFKRFIANSSHGACPVGDGSSKWVMQQWITGSTSNAVHLPSVLVHMPLGGGDGWGLDQAGTATIPPKKGSPPGSRAVPPGLLVDQTGLHLEASLKGLRARLAVSKSMVDDRSASDGGEKESAARAGIMHSSHLKGRCAAVHIGMPSGIERHSSIRQGQTKPGQFSAIVWFKTNRELDKGAPTVRIMHVSFPDPISIEVGVGAEGVIHWAVNGNPIPNGPHFPEVKVHANQWYQLLLTSGPEEGGQQQLHHLYLGALTKNTYAMSRTYNADRPIIELIGKVGGPAIHSHVEAASSVLGGCMSTHHKSVKAMVDINLQDFCLLGSVVPKDQLRFLTRIAFQYARF